MTENIDAIKNILKYSFFLAITIGIIIASGGIEKMNFQQKIQDPDKNLNFYVQLDLNIFCKVFETFFGFNIN